MSEIKLPFVRNDEEDHNDQDTGKDRLDVILARFVRDPNRAAAYKFALQFAAMALLLGALLFLLDWRNTPLADLLGEIWRATGSLYPLVLFLLLAGLLVLWMKNWRVADDLGKVEATTSDHQRVQRRMLVKLLRLTLLIFVCGTCSAITQTARLVTTIGIGPAGFLVSPVDAVNSPSDMADIIEHGGRIGYGAIGFPFPTMSVAQLRAGKCHFTNAYGSVIPLVEMRLWYCR
jgi:hypothetical protein